MTLLDTTAGDISGDPAYADLKRHIVEVTGLAYYQDKDVELASHIERRLTTLRIAECGGYLDVLLDRRTAAAELDELATGLTNGETFFFRHQELFDALREQVIPEMIDRNQGRRRLRVWSAGCANGAEPYSLSIMLQRDFGPQLVGWDVTIVGTDINRDFLAQGQRGEFTDWSLRSMAEEERASCFHRSGNTWTINDTYRRGVTLRHHNLVQDPFSTSMDEPAAYDLVLCRNVMIYFAAPIIHRLVGQFHECLVEGGWLGVGPAEPNVSLFRAFETINAAGAVLYRHRQRSLEANIVPTCTAPVGVLPGTSRVEPCRPMAARIPRGEAKAAEGVGHRSNVAPAEASREPSLAVQRALADTRLKLNLGQIEAAAECCRKLLIAARLNPLVHFYDALIAGHCGRHGDTERALRRTIYLDRDFVLAHYQLGLVLLRRHDACGARRSFRNVLSLLQRRDEAEALADADGLTVGALRQLTDMQMEVLNCT